MYCKDASRTLLFLHVYSLKISYIRYLKINSFLFFDQFLDPFVATGSSLNLNFVSGQCLHSSKDNVGSTDLPQVKYPYKHRDAVLSIHYILPEYC